MHDEDALSGQDSFIDVVCNMVGILIVLVMIVGVRSSRAGSQSQAAMSASQKTAPPAGLEAHQQLAKAMKETMAVQHEVESAAREIVDLSAQALLTDARRQQLVAAKQSVEEAIERRRAALDDESRRQFDTQREIAAAEMTLRQLQQDRIALQSEVAEVAVIECTPTPIAHTVTGEVVLARLKHGQLAVVPMEALRAEAERRGLHYLRNNLRERNQAQEVFGPIDGFRMRFIVERLEEQSIPGAAPRGAPTNAEIVIKAEFMPVADDVGMPVEQALLPNSPLMQALRAKRASAPTLLVFVYPDSYSELRILKRAMWDEGIPLSTHAEENGRPIIISTHGATPVAQ